ncbi:unnamed protein product [Pedinophyceae sp. YPF-701]|nr:unnamed protein product [Pedinophyceae sp. YPF-701]
MRTQSFSGHSLSRPLIYVTAAFLAGWLLASRGSFSRETIRQAHSPAEEGVSLALGAAQHGTPFPVAHKGPACSTDYGITIQGPWYGQTTETIIRHYFKLHPEVPIVFAHVGASEGERDAASGAQDACERLAREFPCFSHAIQPDKCESGYRNRNRIRESIHLGSKILKEEFGVTWAAHGRGDQAFVVPGWLQIMRHLVSSNPLSSRSQGDQQFRLVTTARTKVDNYYGWGHIDDMFMFGHVDDLMLYYDTQWDLYDPCDKCSPHLDHDKVTHKLPREDWPCVPSESEHGQMFVLRLGATAEYPQTEEGMLKLLAERFVVVDNNNALGFNVWAFHGLTGLTEEQLVSGCLDVSEVVHDHSGPCINWKTHAWIHPPDTSEEHWTFVACKWTGTYVYHCDPNRNLHPRTPGDPVANNGLWGTHTIDR